MPLEIEARDIDFLTLHHVAKLSDAFTRYMEERDVEPEGVEINQIDWEGGVQWWARSKGVDGVYDEPVMIYEMFFDTPTNPMEIN